MQQHVASVHEGKKPFNSCICDTTLSGQEDLKSHINSVHKGTKLFSFKFVTAGDVTCIVKRLKNTKATSVDGIPTVVWKKSIAVLAGPIARICNLSLSTGISVGSEPKLCSARLGFGSSFCEKKLGSARLAMPSKKLGSARHILQKKLGSARLAPSFKKPSYL